METPDHVQRNLDEMVKDLFREDEMGAVIRAHIRLENLLLMLVDLLTPFPTYLKKLNLDYDGQVTLALALGLDSALSDALRAMGSLRNKFAHQLETKLDSGTINNLYASLRPVDKQRAQDSFKRIRDTNESIKHVARFAELPPADQFKLIAVTLWAALQAAVLLVQQHEQMRSNTLGKSTSVEVTNISGHGVWLLAGEQELFMSYEDFPWFKDVPVGKVLNVEEPKPGHFYWPDLDVDLTAEIIAHPERFPLKSK